MRIYDSIQYWTVGPTHVAVVADPYVRGARYSAVGGFVVTNDGVNWAAERVTDVYLAVRNLNAPSSRLVRKGAARMEPEWRLPIEWARREARNAGIDDEGKHRWVKFTTAAKVSATTLMPRGLGAGDVSYTGFEPFAKRSAHTLDQIHALVDEALSICARVWGWDGADLAVKFHDDASAYGMAYAIGSGASTGVRRISLNAKLLAKYDAGSVLRTILHELCHHYREERWPRRIGGKWYDSHDGVFCRELARVDPTVKPEGSDNCALFTDVADPAIAAKVTAAKAAKYVEPVWAPAAGFVLLEHLKSGPFRVTWVPRKESGFKWSKWSARINSGVLLDLVKHFSPGEWGAVEVQCPKWGMTESPPTTLRDIIADFIHAFPSKMKPLQDYLDDLQK